MTKDKAIAELVRIWHSPHLDLSLKAGLGEAIEALQAEMEGDLISRGEAVALVNRAIRGIDDKDVQEYLFDGLRKQMWALPSANCDDCIWHTCNYNKIDWDGEEGYISKRDAIDAIEQKAYRHTYLDQIIDIVKSLPSAEPRYAGCTGCVHYDQQQTALICHDCKRSYKDMYEDGEA